MAGWMNRSSTRRARMPSANRTPKPKPPTWAQWAMPAAPPGMAWSMARAMNHSPATHSGSMSQAGARKVPMTMPIQ